MTTPKSAHTHSFINPTDEEISACPACIAFRSEAKSESVSVDNQVYNRDKFVTEKFEVKLEVRQEKEKFTDGDFDYDIPEPVCCSCHKFFNVGEYGNWFIVETPLHMRTQPYCDECARQMLSKLKSLIKAPNEWHEFAEAAFAKALEHIEKYPKDRVDAWNDTRYNLDFWIYRSHLEDRELDEAYYLMIGPHPHLIKADFLNLIMKEALDKGNMALFIYFCAQKLLG